MAVGFLLMAGAYCAAEKIIELKEKYDSERRRRAVEQYCESGTARLSVSDVMKDWDESKKLFPREIRPYLSENPRALTEYAEAIHLDAERKPVCSCIFDSRPFLECFFRHYEKKIRVFNNTGVLYL